MCGATYFLSGKWATSGGVQHGGPVGLRVWGHHFFNCLEDGRNCAKVSARDGLGASAHAICCTCWHGSCEASVHEAEFSADARAQSQS
eukprot:9740414-Alexandrium_andersonii.AAC.1